MRLCFSIILQHHMMWMSLMCCVEFKYSKIHSFIIYIGLFCFHFLYPFLLRTERFPTFTRLILPVLLYFFQFSHSVVSHSWDPMDSSRSGSMGFSRQEYWNGLPFPSPLIVLEYYFFSSDRAVILTFQISQVVSS